jgi:hypothetical protein
MKWIITLAVGAMLMNAALAEEGSRGFYAGKIDSLDVPSRTLRVKSEKSDMTFVVAPDARIIGADREELSLADLKAGDEVTVDYTQENGLYVANTITVKGFPPPQPLPPGNDPVPI